MRFTRLHLGCGGILAGGYLNIDGEFEQLSVTPEPGVVYAVDGPPDTYVLRHDLRFGVPADTGSASVIYHSHFLEHLSRDEALEFLEECRRCLSPTGGTMRIVVPDFELWCRNFTEGRSDFFSWYRSTYLGESDLRYQTAGQVFTGMLYNFGHKMAYDYETLQFVLRSSGFDSIRRCNWGESVAIEGVERLEDDSPRRHESLVVECAVEQ